MSSDTAMNIWTGEPYTQNRHDFKAKAQHLPVMQSMTQLVAAIATHQVVILQSETGSGKTTQLPMYIVETTPAMRKKGGPMLALTQNRRLAADMVSCVSGIVGPLRF